MTVKELLEVLVANPDSRLHMLLPSGKLIPAHFHVTEVGHVQKTFIDCGGTKRKSSLCVLQVWTADDTEHRLSSDKLAKIITLAEDVLGTDDLPVEVEYGSNVASHYSLSKVEVAAPGLLFVLHGRKTDCLAPDKCGVSRCGPNGCC